MNWLFRISGFLNAMPRNLKIGVLLYLDHLSNASEVAQDEAIGVEVQVFVEGVIVPPTILINETLSPLPRSCPRRDLPVGGRFAHFQNVGKI